MGFWISMMGISCLIKIVIFFFFEGEGYRFCYVVCLFAEKIREQIWKEKKKRDLEFDFGA